MCELTFVATTSIRLNKLLLLSQLEQNPVSGHKDGTGFFQTSVGVFKTSLAGNNITNLGEIIRDRLQTIDPVIAHVRLASTAYKSEITREKAHPFESKNFVLAHNGTLEYKDKEKDKEKNLIDSEEFLKVLEEEYNGNNFIESLKKSMEKFTGKFAFLIYEKPADKYYVIRGKTAKLFYSDVLTNDKKTGIIVNTDEKDLRISCLRVKNFGELIYNINITFSEPKELDEETIFGFKKSDYSLEKLGEIKENKVEVPFQSTYIYTRSTGVYTSEKEKDYSDPLTKIAAKLSEFCIKYWFSIEELDELFFHSLGVPLLEAKTDDYETFFKFIVPEIDKRASSNKKLIDTWKEITDKINDPYKEFDLEFPYVFADFKILKTIAYNLKKGKK